MNTLSYEELISQAVTECPKLSSLVSHSTFKDNLGWLLKPFTFSTDQRSAFALYCKGFLDALFISKSINVTDYTFIRSYLSDVLLRKISTFYAEGQPGFSLRDQEVA